MKGSLFIAQGVYNAWKRKKGEGRTCHQGGAVFHKIKSQVPKHTHGFDLEECINIVMIKGGGQSGKSQGRARCERLSFGPALRVPHCTTANNQN